jgi:hypothetical protein
MDSRVRGNDALTLGETCSQEGCTLRPVFTEVL